MSDGDDHLSVRQNLRGRTNLLKTVQNATGGEIRLGYEREGNTVEQPYSQWVLASVEVDDGRHVVDDDGDDLDGPGTLLTTYDYSENRANRLEREILGYKTVTEHQRAYAGDGYVLDDELFRSTRRTYLNDTVFHSGLVANEELLSATGVPLVSTATTWQFIDLSTGRELDFDPPGADAAGVWMLQKAAAPEATSVEQRWHDSTGAVEKFTRNTFEYDTRGNVVRQVDIGEPDLATDDVTAETKYTTCAFRHIDAEGNTDGEPFGVGGPVPPGDVSYTWASVPEVLDVYDHQHRLLRHRDALGTNRLDPDVGKPCDNQSLTRLDERIGADETAITELAYDEWGSYGYVAYPENEDGDRVRVDYVYDADRHTDIASTTIYRRLGPDGPDADEEPDVIDPGLAATATFDPFSGRIASRTDANGNTTSYTYDPFGRLESITGPYEQGTGTASVTFQYHPSGSYPHAIAHHFDAFNPTDTIDTVAFVDGLGRTTQQKQDGTIFRGADAPAKDMVVVSGFVRFDPLGRAVKEWYPTSEPRGSLGAFSTVRSSVEPTVTTWSLRDRVTEVVLPGGRVFTTDYGFEAVADLGATLFRTTEIDPMGQKEITFSDVRDAVHVIDEEPRSGPVVRTRYVVDPLGQLRQVIDNGGNVTTHSYDLLGRRTSTTTPDAGRVDYTWDHASNLVRQVDPNLRARGQAIEYEYEFDKLVRMEYPEGTPDVTYEYGGADAAGNGAGRVVSLVDGAREQTFTYDPLGLLASEVSTMLVHNLNDDTEQRLTFTTGLTYDGLGRIDKLTYPDGEVLAHDYDSGGLISNITGVKAGTPYSYLDRMEYDQFFDRRFQRTGNGVETEYTCGPETRWLSRQLTNTPAREVQDLNYAYDDVGNVTQLHNDIPIPTPDLKGGPSTQDYEYDGYYRLIGARGRYDFPPGKHRDYSFAVTYDENGNITSKNQTDSITVPGESTVEQSATTYRYRSIEYGGTAPHQITRIGRRPYTYDANGNFTGWTDDRTGQSRRATWDATNRMRSVADQGSTTSYTYDHTGRRAIERGPTGETAFVNQWYTVRNGTVAWKHIWAGDDRLAAQRVYDDGTHEHWRYFMHKDLQQSINLVTDDTGLVFQQLEYFPSGEIWVHEKSDVHREPYLYGGGYFDEVRQLIDLGDRWYEPREQFLYSPDPELEDDPLVVLDDPAMLPAYTYAESNPLRLGDFDGRAPSSVRARLAGALRRAGSAFDRLGRTTPGSAASRSLVGSWGESLTTSARLQKVSASMKKYAAVPLVQVNLEKGADGWAVKSVKLGLFIPRLKLKVYGGAAAPPPGGGGAGQPVAPMAQAAPPVLRGRPPGLAIPNKPLPPTPVRAAPAQNVRAQVRPNRPLPPTPANRAAPPPVASSP